MNDNEMKLKGIKQVLLSEFREAEEMGALSGYLWFVRENESTITNQIYLGSKLYGTAEIKNSLENFLINIVSTDNSLNVTKFTSPEGTTVNLEIKINPSGGIIVSEDGISVDADVLDDKFATKESLETVNNNLVTAVNTINQNMADGFDTINKNVADGFNTINGAIDNEIRPGIEEAKSLSLEEKERAIQAETNLQTNINVETNERRIDVSNLQTNINTETNERRIDVSSLQTNINAETNERRAENSELRNKIETEKEERISDISNLQNNINVETNERKIDVSNLQTNINAEIERATAAEEAIKEQLSDYSDFPTQLQAEIERATAAEEAINSKIDDEIKPELDKAVKYVNVPIEGMPERKAIVLSNHDLILGTLTSGGTVNLAMVSKWDKADFGSAQLPINLNGSEVRPTYNDSHEIALMDDVTSVNDKLYTIKLVKDESNDLIYRLMVDNVNCGEINIPKDQFLQDVSYDSEAKVMKFIFITNEGEKETDVDLSNLIDTYTNGNGISLNDNIFSLHVSDDEETLKYLTVNENGLSIHGIDDIINSMTVKYLGDFSTSALAETEAASQSRIAKNSILTYTVNNSSNGIIINSILTNGNVKQYLWLNGKEYSRIITTDNVGAWAENSEIFLRGKGVTSLYLFALNTESTNEQILRGLTYSGKTLTVEDLDKCISGGYELLDEMYDHVKVGFDGQGYTFTKIGMMNPKNNVYACSITLLYNNETNEYSVKANPTKYIIASSVELNEVKDNVGRIETSISELSGKVDNNESSISLINDEIPSIKENVSELQESVGQIGQMSENIIALQQKTETLDAEVKNLKETEVPNLENRVERVEKAISDLPISGLTLDNNISIKSRPNGDPDSPVDLLTLNTDNNVQVGSNIGTLKLISKGKPIFVIDGMENETASSADIQSIQQEIDEIKPELDKAVKYVNVPIEDLPERKAIELANHDLILGRMTNGGTVNLAMVSKWDKADFGSAQLPINLNGSEVRPTYNDNHEIALMDDVTSSLAQLSSLLDKVTILEQKVAELSKTNIETVEVTPDSKESYDDTSKDYVMSGDFSKTTTINGKSVEIKNSTIENDARLKITAENNIDLSKVTFTGDFPKTTANTVLSANNAEYLTFRDMTFDATLYNAVEIGLSGSVLPKGIVFDNCKFLGDFSNNAILIFGTQPNAVININNCYFQKVSNVLRLSNRTNTSCTVNLTNCKVDKWDTTSPWQGMIIMQDYTSPADKIDENNLFAPSKISLNIINCTGPNGKIIAPSDMSEICGSDNEKQVIYVWNETNGLISYSEDKYPKISIQ